MQRHRIATVCFCLGELSTHATLAGAGLKDLDSNDIVTVSTPSNAPWQASGALGSARRSGDRVQYIGCDVYGDTSSESAFCYAADAAHHQLSCIGPDAASVAAASSLSFGSFVAMTVPTGGGLCDSINSDNGSLLTPKK